MDTLCLVDHHLLRGESVWVGNIVTSTGPKQIPCMCRPTFVEASDLMIQLHTTDP